MACALQNRFDRAMSCVWIAIRCVAARFAGAARAEFGLPASCPSACVSKTTLPRTSCLLLNGACTRACINTKIRELIKTKIRRVLNCVCCMILFTPHLSRTLSSAQPLVAATPARIHPPALGRPGPSYCARPSADSTNIGDHAPLRSLFKPVVRCHGTDHLLELSQ
jgi:hypothetical protein